MQIIPTAIPDVIILEPRVFGDDRGFFLETYQKSVFDDATRQDIDFVQDNHSGSRKNVLRGLHYQIREAQGKLVRVSVGAIYDVAVDIRRGSSTFGKYVGVELSAQNRRMLWVPPGFAHGFLTLADWNEVLYKATEFYRPEQERSIRWDDPDISIAWPLNEDAPLLSAKDIAGKQLRNAELFENAVSSSSSF